MPFDQDVMTALQDKGDRQNAGHQSGALAEPVPDGIQMPDSQMPDSQMPDSQMPDSQMPDPQIPDSGAPVGAIPDRPVYPRPIYPRPVIEVTVPGLDAPRVLEREAMMKKLSEFRERGLAAAETE